MVAELSASQVAAKLKGDPDRVVLLDVREPYEREIAAIDPSLHIPFPSIPDRIGEIPREREIVVYCHSGSRSAVIAGFLEAHGFHDVANLAGGIDAWSRTVDPKVPRYG